MIIYFEEIRHWRLCVVSILSWVEIALKHQMRCDRLCVNWLHVKLRYNKAGSI